MSNNEPKPSDIPPSERIETTPSRDLGEIIALVTDEIRLRIEALKAVSDDIDLDEREGQIYSLLAELETAERIAVLAGIEPDLLEELSRITDEQSDI